MNTITITEARTIRTAWIAAKPTMAQEDAAASLQELAEQYSNWAVNAARIVLADATVDGIDHRAQIAATAAERAHVGTADEAAEVAQIVRLVTQVEGVRDATEGMIGQTFSWGEGETGTFTAKMHTLLSV